MDGMEILVFIAIMGLLLYQKSTRKQSKDKKPRQKRPARPVVVPEEEEEFPETVVPIQEPAMYGTDSLYEATLKRKSMRPVPEPKKKVSTGVPATKEDSGEKIHFRSREDARRAFLYSEIFNRKYD